MQQICKCHCKLLSAINIINICNRQMKCSSHSRHTPNDKRIRYIECLEGHTSNPTDGDTLDSYTNSKQPKKEALESICWIMTRNSGDSLQDESIGAIIKLYLSQENLNNLLGIVGVLGSTLLSTSSLVLS